MLMDEIPLTYECECIEQKTFRLLFDGGRSGCYVIDFCQTCYASDDKQFMISMEVIS